MLRRRMPDGDVSELLKRISIATSAGIDMRKAWANEAIHATARWRPAVSEVSHSLANGRSLEESLLAAGRTFSPIVQGMLAASEKAGCEPEVCRELAIQLRRASLLSQSLRRSLIKPAMQVLVAIGAVAVLILFADKSVDMLGLGLFGFEGVCIFLSSIAVIILFIGVFCAYAIASWRRQGAMHHLAKRVPVLGKAIADMELSAWCRAGSLATGIGLDIRHMIELTSAVSPSLAIHPSHAIKRLQEGLSLAEMLRETGLFPRAVVEAVGVGELTGTTAETLDRTANEYDDSAARGFVMVANGVGTAAWVAVVVVVASIIFQVFSKYAGILQDVIKGF